MVCISTLTSELPKMTYFKAKRFAKHSKKKKNQLFFFFTHLASFTSFCIWNLIYQLARSWGPDTVFCFLSTCNKITSILLFFCFLSTCNKITSILVLSVFYLQQKKITILLLFCFLSTRSKITPTILPHFLFPFHLSSTTSFIIKFFNYSFLYNLCL